MSQKEWIDKLKAVGEVFNVDIEHCIALVVTAHYAEFTLLKDGKQWMERFYRIEPKE